MLIRPWSYTRDYLRDVASPQPGALPSLAMLAAHRPDRDTGGLVSPQRVKSGLLLALVRLRSAPGLRRVSRAIPLRWQTRIKTWLRA